MSRDIRDEYSSSTIKIDATSLHSCRLAYLTCNYLFRRLYNE